MEVNVYSITNKINNKRYIGVTQELFVRKRVHFWRLKNGKHPNLKLTNAFKKYGEDAFVFEVLESLSDVNREELLEREILYIKMFDTYKNGYNMSMGGDGSALQITSDETREKHRKQLMGNTYWLGRKHTQETKDKIGNAHRSKEVSVKTRKRMSEYSKARVGSLNPFYGKHHNEETKEKLRKAIGKRCRCIETGVVYDSVKQCAIEMGFPKSRTHINQVCLGKQKTCQGYTFEFVD